VTVKVLRSKIIEIEAKVRDRLNSLRLSSNSSNGKCHLTTGKAKLLKPRVAQFHQQLSPTI